MNKYSDQSKAKKARKQLYGRIHRKGAAVCVKKRSHSSEQAAYEWLKANSHTGVPYQCPHCHNWHVRSNKADQQPQP